MARSVSGGVTKGSRWLLVKNPEEVDDWRNEHQRLDRFLKPKQPLANACSLEEHVCGLWPQRSKGGAAGLVKGVSSPNWPPLWGHSGGISSSCTTTASRRGPSRAQSTRFAPCNAKLMVSGIGSS
jgi:hypothetical protein